jgi:hypothetical protein
MAVTEKQIQSLQSAIAFYDSNIEGTFPEEEIETVKSLLSEREVIRKHIANVLPVLTNLTLGNHALKSTDELHRWVRIPDEGNLQYEKSKELYDKQQELYETIGKWTENQIYSGAVIDKALNWWQAINEVDK